MKMIVFFAFFIVMEHRWNEIDRGKPKYSGGGGTCPSATLFTQILHGMTQDWTRASAVRGRRLTAWAMARPKGGLSFPSANNCQGQLKTSQLASVEALFLSRDCPTTETTAVLYPLQQPYHRSHAVLIDKIWNKQLSRNRLTERPVGIKDLTWSCS
jgi:hypothetical protein